MLKTAPKKPGYGIQRERKAKKNAVAQCGLTEQKMNIYTFHRQNGWYPIELVNDIEAARHIPFNPGTVKVVNETTGKVVYDANLPAKQNATVREMRVV